MRALPTKIRSSPAVRHGNMNSDARWAPSDCRRLAAIAFLAFALRAIVRLYSGEWDFWINGYGFFFNLAHSIAAGDGVAHMDGSATAFRVPLYPAFLAAVTLGSKAFLPIVLAQSLIGAATVLCAALIANEMFGATVALVAAVLTALYPYYVLHDTALQENSLYTFLAALAVPLPPWRRSGCSCPLRRRGCRGVLVSSLALFASFAAVSAVYFAHTGYRSYLDVYWMIFAAPLLVRLTRLARSTLAAPA